MSMKLVTLYITYRGAAIGLKIPHIVPALGPPSLVVKYCQLSSPPRPSPTAFSLCPGPTLHPASLLYHLARIVADAEAAETHAVVIQALGILGDFALVVTVVGEELVQLR